MGMTNLSRRVAFLDEMRGLCILLMIFYHGAYDVVFIFGVDFKAFFSPAFQALQLFIACSFVFIAGISSRYSRSNIARGAKVFAVALAMTATTFFAMRDQLVAFGVLHMLGICMLLHGLVFRNESTKISNFAGMLACLFLFAFTWGISDGYVGFFELIKIKLPTFLYQTSFLFPIGFRNAAFYSSDYFPLLPWAFLFFAGSFLGVAFRQGEMPEFFYNRHVGFLRVLGKHALVIYILHQPLLYALLSVVFMLIKYFEML